MKKTISGTFETAIIKEKCPNCGEDIQDVEAEYLNYPIAGESECAFLTCEKCKKMYTLNVKVLDVKISVEYDLDDLKIL